MPYLTEQDLIDRFGEQEILQLSDRDRDDANDPAVIALVIADATAEIDGWLSSRYILPTPTPQEVVRRACDIARFLLYDDTPSENVRLRYEDALAWLKDVAAGRTTIPGAELIAGTGVSGSGAVAMVASDKAFTDDVLGKMVTGA